jgi:hypothetical protein
LDAAVVFVKVFFGEDGLAGEEPVFEGVLRRALFALFGAGAGGVFGVFAVCLEFFAGERMMT